MKLKTAKKGQGKTLKFCQIRKRGTFSHLKVKERAFSVKNPRKSKAKLPSPAYPCV